MLEPSELISRDNGLGLRLQDQRSLNNSYYTYVENPEIPPKPSDTQHTQHTQRPKPPPKDPLPTRNSKASKATTMTKTRTSTRSRTTSSSAHVGDLVKQLVAQDTEAKESRRLLRVALDKLETLQRRAVVAEEAKKGEAARGARFAQNALGFQQQANQARQDAELYKIQLERRQREIQQQQELMRTIEAERDRAEKEASKAREVARQLNDERLIALARQEGRKMGYLEGMRQGRRLAIAERNQTPLTAFIEEFETPSTQHGTPPEVIARREREAAEEAARRARAIEEAAQKEREAEEAARRAREVEEAARKAREAEEAARKEMEAAEVMRKEREVREAVQREKEAAEAEARRQQEVAEGARRALELEAAKRQAEEQVRREAEDRERQRQAEALETTREALREAERQLEQQRVKEREAELEREREAIRQQEAARALEMENLRRRDEEKEKELAAERERERLLQEERDNERRKREEREAELAREREKVREMEIERDRDREASSVSSFSQNSQKRPPQPVQYLPMPQCPPFANPRPGAPSRTPTANHSPLPLRVPPPNFRAPSNPQVRPQQRRTSQSSQDTSVSGSTSLENLGIVKPPAVLSSRRSHLSDIPEVPSHSGTSDVGRSPAPSVPNHSPIVDASLRPLQGRRGMEDVERWVQSTAASELTPTEPATPPLPAVSLSGPNPSPYGANPPEGSFSSGTINIEVEPPSRPTSVFSPTRENFMFLSPNSRPLQLAPDPQTQPRPSEPVRPVVPVIPEELDDGDLFPSIANFSPGYIPTSVMRTNTSEGSSGDSESRRERTRPGIYGPAVPSSSSGSRISIYANPQGSSQPQAARPQIYSPSSAPSQLSRQTPMQIYGPPSPAQTPRQPPIQIYGASTPSQSSRPLYTPAPPSSTSGSNAPSSATAPTRPSIYGPPASGNAQQRPSIYAPPTASPRTGPVIPPAPQSSQGSIYGRGPGLDRVIPPPPQRQIYNNNAGPPVIPPSSPNGYPYPVTGTATPGSRSAGLPVGATPRSPAAPLPGSRTPGSLTAPLPTMPMGWGSATPGSRTNTLPDVSRGRATPRAPIVTLDEEDEVDDEDLETRMNTEANRSAEQKTSHTPSRW